MRKILGKIKHRFKSLTQTREERRHARVGPAHLWKMKRDFQIKFLKAMNLAPEHYFLDIGCGTLRGGIPLINYLEAGRYYGIDVREEPLADGRKELRESGLEGNSPTLLLSPDSGQLTIDQQFDCVLAFSVLIHMSDEVLFDTLELVGKHLSEGGVFYANVNIGEQQEGNWQGFPVVTRTLEFYRETCARYGLAVSDIGPLEKHGHISGDEAQDSQRMLKVVRAA